MNVAATALRRRLFPIDPIERALTVSTIASSVAKGVMFSVSVLFFVQVQGLDAGVVALGLTVAGGVGVASTLGAGYLVDRVGARSVQVVATLGYGVGLAAYVFARQPVTFLVAACVVVGMQGMERTARNTVIAQSFDTSARVFVRARLRSTMNVFIAAGTGVAALALLVGTTAAYVVAMVGTATLSLVSAIPLRALPRTGPTGSLVRGELAMGGRSPLRDGTYLAVTAFNAVMSVQFGMLTVGVPLWVSLHTRAPAVTVALLIGVNTLGVAVFQSSAARSTVDIISAGRTVARAAVLLALACGFYATAALGGPALAVAVLVVAACAHTAGEVLSETGNWTLAFDLADSRRAGTYQGVSQTGPAIGAMLAPAVVSATAIAHGSAGWTALAALFLAAGGATHWLARRAADARRPAALVG